VGDMSLNLPRSLETDFYYASVCVHQPSGLWTRNRHRPIAANTGKRVPGITLIGSPSRASVVGRDYHRAAPFPAGIANAMRIRHGINQYSALTLEWERAYDL
jgi:hypothetical protein